MRGTHLRVSVYVALLLAAGILPLVAQAAPQAFTPLRATGAYLAGATPGETSPGLGRHAGYWLDLSVLPVGGTVAPSLPPTARSHWKSGAVIGGVVFALVAGYAYATACGDTDLSTSGNCALKTAAVAAMGGAVGFTLGALLGGLFPKSPPLDTTDRRP